MSDPLVIADRVEITALCGEVTDTVMMREVARVACLFTPEAVMRWPHIDKEFVGGTTSATPTRRHCPVRR
ncbi:hypothetical protein [Nocardia arthritidis]|uniref:hypothetical protein n=1 Tax=Nocardia arthritidis TaxID=228602 RepID=UPI0007A403AB|nr:hypothetical protein [Nocardia arthritidis]